MLSSIRRAAARFVRVHSDGSVVVDTTAASSMALIYLNRLLRQVENYHHTTSRPFSQLSILASS